jgi:N-acetyl-gamma-glutamyl-phosphate reductase
MKKINVAVIGASGFTGSEICRILLEHKSIKKIIPVSREKKDFDRAHPNLLGSGLKYLALNDFLKSLKNLDCVFLCTKSTDSYNLAIKLLKKNVKVIDLSSAFRFEEKLKYKKAYGFSQKKNSTLLKKKIAYGLSEFNRKNLYEADLVANPGCYAITAILSLIPILRKNIVHLDQPININAINGTTGAGNNPKIQVSHANATENMLAYNAEGHRHAPEIEEKLKIFINKKCLIDLNTSHGNFRRGIHMRISLNVKKNYIKKINRDKLIKIYKDFYYKTNSNYQFVQVLGTKPRLKKNEKEYDLYPSVTNVIGTNNCLIGLDYNSDAGIIKIIAVTDNLVKGAAGSAIQNMNLIFGFEENTGLTKYGIF